MYVRLIAALALATSCRTASSEPAPPEPETAPEPAPTETVDAPMSSGTAPCAGCTLDVPVRHGAMPLLVVMHGDRERASAAAARWREAARHRGWAVLSLQCPCDGIDSWYQWHGAPAWVVEQVDAVARTIDLDTSRLYLVGWSGGATYIGMNSPSWTKNFAAMVFHGGGQPPLQDPKCPAATLPSYFLVGDKNPAHGAAVRLRDYLQGCGQEVQWDLVDGADHAHEDAALDADKAGSILEWLDAHSRVQSGDLASS